jgi:PhnB protein
MAAAACPPAPPVPPVPPGTPALVPHLCVDGAGAALAFYGLVFDARVRLRLIDPSGRIDHAELVFGDVVVLVADELPEADRRGPRAIGGSPVVLHVYVPSVDAVYERAVDAGATPLRAPEDQFYGDRTAHFEDPFGHRWCIATHVEDVTVEEAERRAREL